jgi:hypothetical protein
MTSNFAAARFFWAGEPASCISFVRRTEQGGYLYRIQFENGEEREEEVGEAEMLRVSLSNAPKCGTTPAPQNSLTEDDAARLEYPMFDGLMAYFPNALAEVSKVSKIGNDQHNPGEPLHWARDKSTDHENKIMRHLVDVGRKDARGVRHSARLAWRALALLQTELEREEGVPRSRASK